MSDQALGEGARRPQLELELGEIGLLVWALGLLGREVESEPAGELVVRDLRRLVDRLRAHHNDLAEHLQVDTYADPPDDSPF